MSGMIANALIHQPPCILAESFVLLLATELNDPGARTAINSRPVRATKGPVVRGEELDVLLDEVEDLRHLEKVTQHDHYI